MPTFDERKWFEPETNPFTACLPSRPVTGENCAFLGWGLNRIAFPFAVVLQHYTLK